MATVATGSAIRAELDNFSHLAYSDASCPLRQWVALLVKIFYCAELPSSRTSAPSGLMLLNSNDGIIYILSHTFRSQYSNQYAVTPNIHSLSEDKHLQNECIRYVSRAGMYRHRSPGHGACVVNMTTCSWGHGACAVFIQPRSPGYPYKDIFLGYGACAIYMGIHCFVCVSACKNDEEGNDELYMHGSSSRLGCGFSATQYVSALPRYRCCRPSPRDVTCFLLLVPSFVNVSAWYRPSCAA